MKLIFSRKGFDAGTGKIASPILPSDELWSIPIPDASSKTSYCDIMRGNQSLGTLVCDLTRGRFAPTRRAHLDPDLDAQNISRTAGWKPIFGQAGAAESHLQKMGVGPGDLFLFFGWFRRVELYAGTYRYAVNTPDVHALFGWLQIERRVFVENRPAIPIWAFDHPHCSRWSSRSPDSLYIATDHLSLHGVPTTLPGAGIFPQFHPSLCLTAHGLSRSVWRLPAWFYPGAGKRGISYHTNPDRWQRDDGSVLLHTVGRGQEFVFDCGDYPEATDWLVHMFSR